MGNPGFEKIELTGTSGKSLEDAIARAAKTVRSTKRFEVIETRGAIKDGKVGQCR